MIDVLRKRLLQLAESLLAERQPHEREAEMKRVAKELQRLASPLSQPDDPNDLDTW